MALDNKFEAYNLPLGSICHLFRDIAAHRPGNFSKIGLRTFVDPRLGGGKLNDVTAEDLVELQQINGETWLFYKSFPINAALVRGTTSDPDGNITMEREALILDGLDLATESRNSPALIIARLERIAANESPNPRDVQNPGGLIESSAAAT